MKIEKDFGWLCKRWGISQFSSHSAYYKVFFEEEIVEGPTRKKPYKINLKKLFEYEKAVGFEPGMVCVAEYVRQNKNSSKYKVLQMIDEGTVKYCILCKSKYQIYYRIKLTRSTNVI